MLSLKGTCSASGVCYDALIMDEDDTNALANKIRAAAASAGGLPWSAVALVAEQDDRMQDGLAVQVGAEPL